MLLPTIVSSVAPTTVPVGPPTEPMAPPNTPTEVTHRSLSFANINPAPSAS
ncbi:hypothetical protein [uncultured Treponema sp.]|uniref:hypothetical protein n=1 Tax=uncultured Treponema sp. TaxID=162155 RepID=UPI002600A94A|nr:hypothetical protein [uncultured Treponema sp.]